MYEIKKIKYSNFLLNYRVASENKNLKSTLVIVHGVGSDSRIFQSQLKFFAKKMRVIAIDLPGHGRSKCDFLPTLENYCNSIETICEKEGITQAIFLGHSMGGGIIFELFKRKKHLFSGMIQVASGATLAIEKQFFNLIDEDFDSFLDFFINLSYSKKADLIFQIAKKGITPFLREIVKNDLSLCSKMNYLDVLSAIDFPFLVIANRFDELLNFDLSFELKEKVNGADMVVFDEKGHVPFFENAENFNLSIEKFLLKYHLLQ